MSRRFLPTIEQIKLACEELPDPSTFEDEECTINCKNGNAERTLSFKRVKFASGKGGSIQRWVYEGKIMIRNSDIAEKKRRKESEDETVIFSLSVK